MDDLPLERAASRAEKSSPVGVAIASLALVALALLLLVPSDRASAIGTIVGGIAGVAAVVLARWQLREQRRNGTEAQRSAAEGREMTEASVNLQRVQLQAQLGTGFLTAWLADDEESGQDVTEFDPGSMKKGHAVCIRLMIRRVGKGEVLLNRLEMNRPITDPMTHPSVSFPVSWEECRGLVRWFETQFPSLSFFTPIILADVLDDGKAYSLFTVRVGARALPDEWERFKRISFNIYWHANIRSGPEQLASGLAAYDARQDLTL